MVLARGHYGEFDTENYRVGILQSLSTATGSDVIIEAPSPQPTLEQATEPTEEAAQAPAPTGDVSEVLLQTIRMKDDGDGVDYDTLVHAAVMAGHSREEAEDAIDIFEISKVRLSSQGSASSCLLYTSPSPRDATLSRMPSSA